MLNSKKTSLIILGAISLVVSRSTFALFNDPEGPNLLIVVVLAAILFSASWATYSFVLSTTNQKRFWLALATQIVLAAGLYFFFS